MLEIAKCNIQGNNFGGGETTKMVFMLKPEKGTKEAFFHINNITEANNMKL